MIPSLTLFIDQLDLIDLMLMAVISSGYILWQAYQETIAYYLPLAVKHYRLSECEPISLDAKTAFIMLITLYTLIFLGLNRMRRSLWQELLGAAQANDSFLTTFRMHIWRQLIGLIQLGDGDGNQMGND